MTCDNPEVMEGYSYNSYEEKCLCLDCKCRQCEHYIYDPIENSGRCDISLRRGKYARERIRIEIDAWLKETEKAYFIVVNNKDIWVPKSLTKIESSDKETFIVLPRWLAEMKEISDVHPNS